MASSIELGTMFVTYKAKTDELVAGMNTSKTAMSAADAIAQSTGKNIANAFTQAGTAVAGFGAKTVSGVDVAQAKLTLLESKVTEARAKLETLQNAANAGQAVTGIAEAEAQLTLLEHDAQNARTGLQQLQEQEQQTGAAAASMASQEEQAAMATMSLGERISSGANHLLDFGSKLGMAVVGVQGLMQGAQSLGQALLGPAAAAEQVEGSLTVFTGSAEKARQEMQALSEAASHSPFKTMDVDQFALKLQSVGVSAQDVIPDFLAIGDSLDAVGRTSSADLGQMTDAFIKIQTEGHLSTGVMGSFAAMGVDAWSVLEKQTGKTHQALASMISHGLYPAKQAMHDLTVGIEANPLFKGQMANDANVFNGALSTLQSNWQQLLAAFGSPIIKGLEPIMGNLASAMSSPAFQNFATQTGKWIVDTLGLIGQIAGNLIGPILQLAGAFLKIFGIDFSKPKSAVDGIATAIYQFSSIMQGLADKSAIVGKGIADFATWMDKGGISAQIFKDILLGIAVAFATIQIGAFLATVPALIAGFIGWAVAAGAAAIATIAATWPILAIGAGIAIVVAGIILAVQHWGDISKWLQGAWANTASFFQGIWTKIVGVFGGIGHWFQDRFNEAKNGIQSAWGGTGNWFQQQGKSISDNWNTTAIAVGNNAKWLYDHNYYVKGFVDGSVTWFNDAKQKISDAWNTTTINVGRSTLQTTSYLQQQWALGTTWLNQQWQRLAGWASSAWNGIATTIGKFALQAIAYLQQQWVLGSIWLQQQWNKVVTMATQLWQAVAKVFSGIWTTYISGPLGSFWKSFTSWWNGIVSQAIGLGSNLIKGVASGISSAAGAVGGAIHSAIGGALANLGFHNIPGFPGYAEGIMDSPAGHLAWVGERGKELMYVPKGASIFPANSPQSHMFAGLQSYQPSAPAATDGGTRRPVYSQAQSMALATSSAIHVAAIPLQGGSNNRGTPIIITLDGRQVGKGVMPHIGPEMARELKAVLR